MKLSIIIPVFNSESSIKQLVEQLILILGEKCFQIILVNDHSKDKSEQICLDLSNTYNCVDFIGLRKNFGEHNAVMCGFHFVKGDYAVIIDDDFQNPPSEILKLVNCAISGNYDVVFSKYKTKKHPLWRNIMSKINNRIASMLLNKPKDLYLSSFKVIKSELLEEIIKYKGPFPYIDGLILRISNSFGTVEVEHHVRKDGVTNYTFKKLFSLYMNMFINFSVKPLRFFTISGLILFFLGFLLSIDIVYEKIFLQNAPQGWTLLTMIVLVISGFQSLFLGIIAEYLGKLFLDHNGTPQYVIKTMNVKKND